MKDMEIKVSLVVTVYNRQDTLTRCLESAVQQTQDRLEIVVVDDCSTDQSVELVKKYMRKYPNIALVKCPKNGGVGYAKNMGVKAARGEYITFLDSDDYLDPGYIENLYLAIQKTESDIAVADICIEGSSSTVCRISEGNLVTTVKGLSQFPLDKLSIVPGIVVAGFWGAASCCTKLVRREMWLQFPFYEGRRCDDLSATLPLLALSKQIVYVPQCTYHYVESADSMERLEYSVESQLAAVDGLRQYLIKRRKHGISIEYEYIFVATSVLSVLTGLFEAKDIAEHTDCVEQAYCLLQEVISLEAFSESTNPYLAEQSKVEISSGRRLTLSLFPLFAEGRIQELACKLFRWRGLDRDFYPKVSVIIPVYNGANYMREAIDSALNQTYNNIEVIVVNDGSEDCGETDKIARSYGNRIRYFKKENGGVATALNLGIEKMTGEYFSWLSHDDMYNPNKIEEELRWLAVQTDKTTIIAEGYQVVNSAGEYMYTVNLNQLYPHDRLKNPMFLVMRGGINGCALLIHKSHFERVGLFDPMLPTTQDYDLWFRMFRGQNVYYMESSNVLSRSHEEQGSKALLSDHVKECDALWIRMMDTLTVVEKKAISGSECVFYRETCDFLRTGTGYLEATLHAECEMYRTAVDEFERTRDNDILKIICDFSGYQKRKMLDNILPLRNKKGGKPRIIFYLADRYELGGLNRVVLQTAGLLTDRYDVIITTLQDPLPTGYPAPKGVTEIKLPWNLWSPIEKGAFKLSYLAYILQVDVLVNSYNCDPNWLAVYENAQRFGIHTIAWNYESYFLPYWRASLYGSLSKRNSSLKKADVVIWSNSFSAQAYRAFGENGIVLPNPNPFAGKAGTEQALPENLLAIGRFDDSRKGLEDLLRMFRLILDKRPNTRLWIVGPCNLDVSIPSDTNTTYRKLIQKLQLPEKSLQFEGEVSDVEGFYQKACVHILPSKYEGFGLTILEAATIGLPSVVYGGSGTDDIITSGVDGYTVPPGDWKSLADCVLELLENPELRASMSMAAKMMTDRYAPERIVDMWNDVINAILEKDPTNCTEYLTARYSYRPYEDHGEFTALCAQEYERCIYSLLSGNAFVAQQILPAAIPALESQWQAECERLQQSFSWRITKPLRLIKKSFVILKTEGFGIFLKKVHRKLFHQ